MKYGSKSNMQTNSAGLSGQFTIGDMAAVKRILAGHMYSFPIQTLVQEYLSNARDALRAAGNPKGKIVVNLPKRTDLRWSVRDYGIGMDEETVSKVFTSYGVSTKRGDNSQTGGFGVGSKSAFAYTSTFIVKAFKDGIRREFIMATETADSPAGGFLKTVEEKTSEPNGVEISIPVDAKDVDAFITATQRAIEFWDVRPEVVGAPVSFVEPAVTTSNSVIFSNSRGRSVFFVIDGIPYPCPDEMYREMTSFRDSDFEKMRDTINGSIGIKFLTGELIPASSREAILDSKENRDAIEKKSSVVLAEIQKFIQETLVSNSIEELFKNSKKIESTFHYAFNNQVTINGETFSYDNRGVFIFGSGVDVKILSRPSRRRYGSNGNGEIRIDGSYDAARSLKYSDEKKVVGISASTKEFKFIHVDEEISNADIIRKLEQNFPSQSRFMVLSSEGSKAKLNMLADAFDSVATSTLQFTKPERVKRASGLVSFMKSMSERSSASIDSMKLSKYVYANTDDRNQMSNIFKSSNLDGFIRSAGYVPRGFSSRVVKQLTEAGVEVISLDSFLASAASTVSQKTKESVIVRHLDSMFGTLSRSNQQLLGFVKQNASLVDQTLVNAVLNFEERRKQVSEKVHTVSWSYVPESVTNQIIAEASKQIEADIKAIKTLEAFSEKLPIVKMITSGLERCDQDQKTDMLDYINKKVRGDV